MLLDDDGCLCCCLPGLFGVEDSVKNNESDSSIAVRAILGGLDDRQNTSHKQFLEVVCAKCFGYCHIADLKLKLFTLSFEAKNGRNSRDGYLRIFDMDLRQITAETRLSLPDPVPIQSSPNEETLYNLGLKGLILRVPYPYGLWLQ